MTTTHTPSVSQANDQDNREPAEHNMQPYGAWFPKGMLHHWDHTNHKFGSQIFEAIAFEPSAIKVRESFLELTKTKVLEINLNVEGGLVTFKVFGMNRDEFIRALLA